ncbi:protein FATTY ACID EXPORT 3, chloroplastic-like isoform X2 [Tasmannia lanceolata]|uniref:protein FATTY ACID EXPORT 3, chloroplastic-like isoform X2 n=1 Tax=Tasmannia lanceolata TaxID=3420 RepID=UPI0040639E9A
MRALDGFVLHRNPNIYPNPTLSVKRSAYLSRFLHMKQCSAPPKGLGYQFLGIECWNAKLSRNRSIVSFATSQDGSSDIEVGKEKTEIKLEVDEIEEAWKEMLESFKKQAIKMQGISQEAYEVYSKKAIKFLMQTSVQMKIQADKARQDLAVVVEEINNVGKEYLSVAAENSPETVQDIVETFSSSADESREISNVRDFYLGIPYGALLSVGGFLSFMLTGSISAVRFGVILGGALLVLSISSLRSWKHGKSSTPYLKGQAAIAVIIFVREFILLSQRSSFLSSLKTLISGAMVLFYVYRILLNGQKKGPSLKQGLEN